MMLVWILIILMGGGFLCWITVRWSEQLARWVCLACLAAALVILLACGIRAGPPAAGAWMADYRKTWIPGLGIDFHLALDGLSFVMGCLALFVGALAFVADWATIRSRSGFYCFNFLWLMAGILGVFFALDLVLFYFFWEVMLVPAYFLVIGWGYPGRREAGMKFFLFTQLSGLAMLLAIWGLYMAHGRATGVYTFEYGALLGTPAGKAAGWLMAGFLAAFLVKLPAVPLHSWMPDAYVQAPLSGTVMLAAVMSKTGAYGILRFAIPLFPEAARSFGFWGMLLGVLTILYGAKMAYGQTDLKRLIAFSSLSHMGFILVGAFAFTTLAYAGVLLEIVTHGLGIAGLFVVAAVLYQRTGSFRLDHMGGFWRQAPAMGGMTLVLVMASLGLPGLGNFVAEFMVLAGAWQVRPVVCAVASLGLIVSVIYSLVIFQRVFHEKPAEVPGLRDLSPREWTVAGLLVAGLLWLGFFPGPVWTAAGPSLSHLLTLINSFGP